MTAAAAAAALRAGELSAEALVRACLDRIAAREGEVHAWAHLDADLALAQARAADQRRLAGEPLGPLHGVPVGVKDIFDTADLPTENGTVLHAGRRPSRDATAVALLRQAGAVILGKTVTAEMAVYSPGPTTNPHDARRTPGGSSSGSAAAVAAGMVPLAIGTQTNGSVLRPASYCGVVGFKPSHGAIARQGVLKQSPDLDHVGVFARTVDDAALIARVLGGDVAARAPAAAWDGAPPRVAFVKTPVWDQADAGTRTAFEALAARWRGFVREVALPPAFDSAHGWHRTIMEADLANSFANEYAAKERLSGALVEMIERGQRSLAVDYSRARDGITLLSGLLDELFRDFDAILTPATQGIAPLGLASTGSPMFCTIWTLCGVPAISLPLLQGDEGMPLGVQLVGPKGQDGRLLQVAAWLAKDAS